MANKGARGRLTEGRAALSTEGPRRHQKCLPSWGTASLLRAGGSVALGLGPRLPTPEEARVSGFTPPGDFGPWCLLWGEMQEKILICVHTVHLLASRGRQSERRGWQVASLLELSPGGRGRWGAEGDSLGAATKGWRLLVLLPRQVPLRRHPCHPDQMAWGPRPVPCACRTRLWIVAKHRFGTGRPAAAAILDPSRLPGVADTQPGPEPGAGGRAAQRVGSASPLPLPGRPRLVSGAGRGSAEPLESW
ncbi:unnamed protein product [Nyctereutes procyonoides]|uniref:(raccoon dog) hypothetical protein n=1 Tax=Nyctereutes procyonoides TaxID=34880 RepID=A0A811XTQ7_NYCPR|nr:unnamed protein product [Nyctereutes procyonoides]